MRLPSTFRGPIESAERNALIGLNIRGSQRFIADGRGARGKFVAVYSQDKEFVFGDGFFHTSRTCRWRRTRQSCLATSTQYALLITGSLSGPSHGESRLSPHSPEGQQAVHYEDR